jgi:hypothetical protein
MAVKSLIKRFLGSGLALVLLVAALSVGSVFSPAFTVDIGRLPAAAEQQAKAADLNLVCPGAAYRAGGSGGDKLGQIDQIGSAEVNSINWARTATVTSTELAGPNSAAQLPATSGIIQRMTRATSVVVADASGKLEQGSQLLNISTLQLQSEDTFSGLLAAPCQKPASELWFVGGDTTVGREALLIVTNPSKVDAQIDVAAFSSGGQITADGLEGLAVPAGKTLVLPLASDLTQQATLALHIQATGGSVAAWLQQRVVRGTIAGGSDFISPAAEFGKNLMIPGLLLRGSADAAAIITTRPAYADQTPMLRVFAPVTGNGSAKTFTLTAQIFGATSKTFGTVVRQTVTAGAVTDIPISGLSDGDYVAFVSAEQPVRAAIRLPRTNKAKSPATDFAWLQAGESLAGLRAFRVPQSGVTKLSLGNSGKSEVSLVLGNPEQVQAGTAPTVKLAAGAVRTIGLTAGAMVWLKTDATTLRANLVIDVDSALATLPITDYKNLPSQLLVSVR